MAKRKTVRPTKKTSKAEPSVAKRKRRRSGHMGEISAICAIAAAILLGIGIYTGGGGVAGQALSGICRGLFGLGALLLPIAAAGLGVTLILKRFEPPDAGTVCLYLSLFLCITILAHVPTRTETVYDSFSSYASAAYNSGSAGGLLGALAGDLSVKILGVAGTYIIIIAIGLVLTILLTDKSFFKGIMYSINKARSLRPERYDESDYEYFEEDAEPEEPPRRAVKHQEEPPRRAAKSFDTPRTVQNPKKATVTIQERPSGERPRILMFNDEPGSYNPRKTIAPVQPPPENQFSEEYPEPFVPRTYPPDGAEELYIDTTSAEPPVPARMSAQKYQARQVTPGPFVPDKEIDEEAFENSDSDNEPFDYNDELDEMLGNETLDEMLGNETLDDMFDDDTPEPEIVTLRRRGQDDIVITEKTDMDILKEQLTAEKPAPPPFMSDKMPTNPRMREMVDAIRNVATPGNVDYIFPHIDLLNQNLVGANPKGRAQILENSRKLESTLKSFGVEAKVVEVSKGPTVTRYELSPGQGVKVSKIAGLADDLALNLAAVGIRIEAPIPGKAAVGIEIPNKEVTPVFLREVIEDPQFQSFPSNLAFALGKDIAGNTVITDIAKMPHLLIAGATGSGKSVCVNTLVTSLLYKADPNEVKLVMIDPKVVELSVYNGIPHLLIPVVTDARKAAGALNWAVVEMLNRYNLFAETSVRDLKGYNAILRERGETPLPQIVIIIDELSDLMMAAPGEVEDAICRLAQMARAAGLHLIIATQRPSVDVITGLIKANIPSRLAFSVSSGTDSRTILDTVGAEKLLGKGDMLFYPVGMSKPQRVQGAFISDKEVESIVAFVKNNATSSYDQDMINKITSTKSSAESTGEVDELFIYASEFVIEKDKASASMLQRQFRIGYNKAARLIEELESRGIVGPEDGSKPRKVLMNSFQWEEYKQSLTN